MTTETDVTFDSQIVQDVRDELVHARETAWHKRRELDPEAATVVHSTIRLGTDYARAPVIVQPSLIPFAIKHQRNKLGNRAWDTIELGIESLAGYFSKKKLKDNLEDQAILHESGDDETSQSRLHKELIVRHLRNELNCIRKHVSSAIYCSYEIGKFDGFEKGQNSIKDAYKDLGCHSDAKIYSFATTLVDGYGTAVDLYSTVKCGCGECIYCIRDNTAQYNGEWPGSYQSAKDAIDGVETELAKERRRKRARHVL